MSGRLPEGRGAPVSFQDWRDLTFAHWPCPAPLLQPLLPPGLTVQSYGGTAWLGVVAFVMDRVRPVGGVPVPGWSTFPELNVRTYVRDRRGRDGIWFLSADCDRVAFVLALRALGLPYHWARGQVAASSQDVRPPGSTIRYRFARRGITGRALTRRRDGPARRLLDLTVEVGAPLPPGARTGLVDALTGRWAAYSVRAGTLLRFPVDHPPWPLHEATVRRLDGGPTSLVDGPPPLVHFSPGVAAAIGVPALVPGTAWARPRPWVSGAQAPAGG